MTIEEILAEQRATRSRTQLRQWKEGRQLHMDELDELAERRHAAAVKLAKRCSPEERELLLSYVVWPTPLLSELEAERPVAAPA